MIYITGDVHRDIDIHKLSSANWPEGETLTRDDYLIICGDFGLVWDNEDAISQAEQYWTEWLNEMPWTTLFVDGNHENHDRLNRMPVIEKFGGKVHKVADNIYHLMRGEYYNIDGSTFFTMGGAASHDRHYRTEGVSWWSNEMPSINEMNWATDNLRAHNMEVDYIITHCAPRSIQAKLVPWYEQDGLTSFLNFIYEDVKFKKWFCGHYHIDLKVNEKFVVCYDKIISLS